MPIDLSFPAPQADRLDKVAVVVDAVSLGADTHLAVARALGMVDRQGSYYANAAAYLGLISLTPHSSPQQFELTDEGRDYLTADADVRSELLCALVAQVPAVQAYQSGKLSEACELYSELGLDDETARRRAQTASVWAAALADGLNPDDLAAEAHATRDLAAEVAEAIAIRRNKEALAARPACCSRCYLALPLTGRCDDCD